MDLIHDDMWCFNMSFIKKRHYLIGWLNNSSITFKKYIIWWLTVFLDLFSMKYKHIIGFTGVLQCHRCPFASLRKQLYMEKENKLTIWSVLGCFWLTCVSTCQPWRMKRTSRPPAPKESQVCRTPECSLAS